MNLAALAGSPLVQALGSMLLHFLWQGALIAAALWVALAALSPSQAAARYAACSAALGLMVLAPSATLAVLLASEPVAARAVALAGPPAAPPGAYFHLLLLGLWLLGGTGMTARLAWGVGHLRQLVRRAAPPPALWQQVLGTLALRVGVPRSVRLLVSEQVDSPLVLGWLRPVILVPVAALTSLPPAYVEALLVHELGHVRRLDYLVNVVQSCAEAALFYHPAVHWVSRRMRFEREHCCDDIAVQMTGEPLRYARALADMEALRARIPEPAVASKGGSLMHRIERITRPRGARRAPSRAGLAASVLLASALGLSLMGAWACSSSAPEEEAAAPLVPRGASLAADDSLGVAWLPSTLDRWKPALADTARRYGLDPALLAIVTLVESGGNPDAHSPSGAIGLMQIMPGTGAHIAEERGLLDYSEDRLWEPTYNMDFGGYYLAQALASFGAVETTSRSVELAAVAYNGGPRVLGTYLGGDPSLYAETARYRDVVVGMWNERGQAESPTYAAWLDSLRSRRAAPQP